MSETKAATFHDLAAKGDGVLVKRGDVWTFPSAETDRSGTNVVLPVEYVSDAEVQQAIRDGHVHPVTTAPGGAVLSVRVTGDAEPGKAISVAQAGTPEAGTELPPNSRPSHDAGMKPASPHDAERVAAAAARGPKAEGSEVRRPHTEGHETGGRNRNR